MEEIKVGEYVRTKTEGICKLIANEKDASGRYTGYVDKPFFLREDNILKHSPNIIDLIECGDYVNGYKVSFKGNDYKPFVQCDYPVKQGTTNHYLFYEEAIENIVTKEQFNSIKYVIGE